MVDAQRIQAAQAGDRDALIALLQEIESHIYRTAYYLTNHEQDASDAAQEALIRIYQKIKLYEEKAQFKTWVQRIVTNVCIDMFRKRKDSISIDQHELVLTSTQSVEDEVISSDFRDQLNRAIEQLPEQHRAVVVLRYLHEFSYDEIAESLDLPLNTVKSYLYRSRQQLQILLQDYQKGGVQG